MRAARTALRLPALPQLRTKEPKRKTMSARRPDCVVWLGAAFLAGYLPGIWLGRDGATALGQQLAVWYTESPESTAFAAAFGARFAVGALQLCAVLLCGFCIWGVGLLVLFFAARGGFLGFCAASVAAADGAAGLPRYGCIGCCHAAVVSVAGRVVGAVGGTAVLCSAGARHKGNAGDRAAAFEPLCSCNGFVSGCQCCRGCPRPRCRQRAIRAFPPHISDWPAGRRQRLFSAVHG